MTISFGLIANAGSPHTLLLTPTSWLCYNSCSWSYDVNQTEERVWVKNSQHDNKKIVIFNLQWFRDPAGPPHIKLLQVGQATPSTW